MCMPTKPVLLIVDDDELILDLLTDVLQDVFTVVTAENGLSALEKLRRLKPSTASSPISRCLGWTALNWRGGCGGAQTSRFSVFREHLALLKDARTCLRTSCSSKNRLRSQSC